MVCVMVETLIKFLITLILSIFRKKDTDEEKSGGEGSNFKNLLSLQFLLDASNFKAYPVKQY